MFKPLFVALLLAASIPVAQARAQGADLSGLHDALHLTAVQEDAWRVYRQALAPDPFVEARHKAARAMIAGLPAPRRVDLINAEMEADLNAMRRQGDAVKAFYATLSPAQQATFDRQTQQAPRSGPTPRRVPSLSARTSHVDRRAALDRLEILLAADKDDIGLLVAKADLLTELGRFESAQDAYLAALSRQPDHLPALNNFGALVHAAGYRSAARTLYAEAVRRHPADAMSQVNLANSLVETDEIAAAQEAYEAALRAAPDYAPAHRGLALLASMRGDVVAAARSLTSAFGGRAVIEQPYRGEAAPIEVLMLISGLPGDIPLEHVLDPLVFRVTALAPQFFADDQPLPEHHLVFNAIGDADLCADALKAAIVLGRRTARPVINPPERVLETHRVDNALRLGRLPDVIAAPSVSLSRQAARGLTEERGLAAVGLVLPIAVRAPGFHTGRHFERVGEIAQLTDALAALPGDDLILMNYLDTRGPDGKFRKYRAMLVDGEIYPLHLAVSTHWKVHYFTADMIDAPTHRAEDAAFLQEMPGVIGARAMVGLGQIRDTLGLDYGGVDFALSPDGAVVLFEANATMVVYPPPPGEMWDYRRGPVQTLLERIKTMIRARA